MGGEKGIEFDIKPLISAITLDDFQGVFYLGGLMLGCSLLVFLTEIVWLECVNMFSTNKDMSKENQQMAWDNAASLVNQDHGTKSIAQIINRSKHRDNNNKLRLRENRGTANV